MITPSIGISNFFKRHFDYRTGYSWVTLPPETIQNLIAQNWKYRKPGMGEGDRLDRKVLVPINLRDYAGSFFQQARVKPVLGMPIQAHIVARQEGEDPYVETYVAFEDAVRYGYQPVEAVRVDIVCYSAEALLENNGTRSTDDEWEAVALLCAGQDEDLMMPLTMARNHLEKTGGTKPAVPYTSDEWAEAIWQHSINRGIKIMLVEKTELYIIQYDKRGQWKVKTAANRRVKSSHPNKSLGGLHQELKKEFVSDEAAIKWAEAQALEYSQTKI
jgi:hypothetical protein